MKKNLIRLATLFLGLVFFSSIPLAIIEIFLGISYSSFSYTSKIIYSLICDVAFLAIVLYWNKNTIKKDFNKYKKDILGNIETSLKYWLIGFIVMIVSNLILSFINKGGIAGNEEAVRDMVKKAPLYMAFSTAIYAPLTEEIIFRKCFKDVLKSKWLFILMSGLTFGAMHIVGTYTNLIDLLYLIPYSSLGIAFAYNYYKTNNIFSTIVMHFLHNSLTFLLYIVVYGTAL